MLEKIKEFISTAQKNRKYASNTASGFKAAINLFEAQLNENEREDITLFRKNIDQIAQQVFAVNKSSFSVATINEYKRRIIKLLSDYENYGVDPSKMASWNPLVRVRNINTSKKIKLNKSVTEIADNRESTLLDTQMTTTTRFELPLRPNVKAVILTPSDITKEEVVKIKKYIEYLESMTT